jgi:folylpolyglutamate synthase/dihydropteroate synthase
MEPERLVEMAHQFGCPARIVPTIEEALAEAIHLAEGEAIVLVTGSIFIAAGARDTWYNQIVVED